jgi:hypothetical protein
MKRVEVKALPRMAAEMKQTSGTLSAMCMSMSKALTPEQDEALAHAMRVCNASAGLMRSDLIKRAVEDEPAVAQSARCLGRGCCFAPTYRLG